MRFATLGLLACLIGSPVQGQEKGKAVYDIGDLLNLLEPAKSKKMTMGSVWRFQGSKCYCFGLWDNEKQVALNCMTPFIVEGLDTGKMRAGQNYRVSGCFEVFSEKTVRMAEDGKDRKLFVLRYVQHTDKDGFKCPLFITPTTP